VRNQGSSKIRRRIVAGIGLLAVSSAVVVSAAGTSQAAGPVNPVINPPPGQTAVKSLDDITLRGTVGPGATQGRVSSARLLAYDSKGAQIATFTADRTSKTNVSGTDIQGGGYSLTACPPNPQPQVQCWPDPEADGGWIV
jgi:hypothetical protein